MPTDDNGGARHKSFGAGLELNCEGDVLVVSVYGYYQVYTYGQVSQTWNKAGTDPVYNQDDEGNYMFPTGALAKKADTPRVATVPFYDTSVVQVFDVNVANGGLSQQGPNITAANTTSTTTRVFGRINRVALSDSGGRVVVTFVSGSFEGFAVFDFANGVWRQVGYAIGSTVVGLDNAVLSMNGDATRIAVSDEDGDIMIYQFDGSHPDKWLPIGQTLSDDTTEDVEMVGLGSIVVVDHGREIQAYFYPEGKSFVLPHD